MSVKHTIAFVFLVAAVTAWAALYADDGDTCQVKRADPTIGHFTSMRGC